MVHLYQKAHDHTTILIVTTPTILVAKIMPIMTVEKAESLLRGTVDAEGVGVRVGIRGLHSLMVCKRL